MLTSDELQKVHEVVHSLLSHIPLKLNASIKEGQNDLQININGNDRPYLLTDHGETLLSLQFFLARMIHQKVTNAGDIPVYVDSDGFLYRHEQDLKRMAQRTVQRVRAERRGIKLSPMNPHERRIIHLEVSRYPDMDSVSEGEGFLKKVIVKKKRY